MKINVTFETYFFDALTASELYVWSFTVGFNANGAIKSNFKTKRLG